jgi:hypothetical protein
MAEKIINATFHPINILNEMGVLMKVFPKTGVSIRLEERMTEGEDIDGIPTGVINWDGAVNMPEQKEGVFYIVSQLTQSLLTHRSDLLSPKGIVRDNDGNVLGCRMFSRTQVCQS